MLGALSRIEEILFIVIVLLCLGIPFANERPIQVPRDFIEKQGDSYYNTLNL